VRPPAGPLAGTPQARPNYRPGTPPQPRTAQAQSLKPGKPPIAPGKIQKPGPVQPGKTLTPNKPTITPAVKRPLQGQQAQPPAKVPRIERRRPLDDDEEILEEEKGEETLANLVAEWDGTVLSIADIAARETDQTIAKHIADAQEIAALNFEKDLISEVIRDSGKRLTMLIEDTTAVVGFMVYSYVTSAINVMQIAISDAHRGRGLGRCAITWILAHAEKAGLDAVFVHCTSVGEKFYERCGFTTTRGKGSEAITMSLNMKGGKAPVPPATIPFPGPPPGEKKADDAAAGPKAVTPAAKPGEQPAMTPGLVAGKPTDKATEPEKKKGKTVAPPNKAKAGMAKPGSKADGKPADGAPEEPEEQAVMTRGTLIMRLFEACDQDKDKHLNMAEMGYFARHGGFEGTDAEWTKEYKFLCAKRLIDSPKGLDMKRFEEVINDGTVGVYTDNELQALYRRMTGQTLEVKDTAKRAEAVSAVFKECDDDEDGYLNMREMKRIAVHIGFVGGDEEWKEEYNDMCRDSGADPILGISFELFAKLVDDESEKGCYCSDDDLEAVLTNKIATAQAGPRTVKPPPRKNVLSSRQSVTAGLFKNLDKDGDGYLNESEMKFFANLIGFKCDDEKWSKEFALFCAAGDADVKVGINAELFAKLVDDRSDAGCYCSEIELKDMLKEINPNAGELSSRGALITAVFNACDQDKDGRLNNEEMRVFAKFTGFDGPEEAWEKEYKMLCGEVYAKTEVGLEINAFTRIVNDTSERGCYCRDVELAAMVRQLGTTTFVGAGTGMGGDSSVSLVSRAAIIRTIFHLCDTDDDKLLKDHEMLTFAAAAGFNGSHEEWTREYQFVCNRSATNPLTGLNPMKFIMVINNGSAGKYSDEELKVILQKLELQQDLNAGATGRSGVVRAVFHACDLDSDGYLNRGEMKSIVNHIGFKGTADEWANEFRQLCLDNGADPAVGIDCALLEALVNDSTEGGCYCSDRDLRAVLQSMGETDEVEGGGTRVTAVGVMQTARGELIRQLFRACDSDNDGLLDEVEMRSFAVHVGFDGSNEEWAAEYKLLCAEKQCSGVNMKLFEKLANDNSENGCHCTDEQLQTILTKLSLGFR